MRRAIGVLLAIGLVFLTCFLLIATAQSIPATEAGDVRQVVSGFAESWNHHDMEAFGRLFAPDADFVNVSAVLMKGREEIQSHHAWSHGTIPESTQGPCCHGAAQQYGAFKNSTMKFDTIDVRFLQKDVAVAHVSWQLFGDARASTPRRGVFLFVLTRQDGSWLISTAQNTETTESRRQHECAAGTNLVK